MTIHKANVLTLSLLLSFSSAIFADANQERALVVYDAQKAKVNSEESKKTATVTKAKTDRKKDMEKTIPCKKTATPKRLDQPKLVGAGIVHALCATVCMAQGYLATDIVSELELYTKWASLPFSMGNDIASKALKESLKKHEGIIIQDAIAFLNQTGKNSLATGCAWITSFCGIVGMYTSYDTSKTMREQKYTFWGSLGLCGASWLAILSHLGS